VQFGIQKAALDGLLRCQSRRAGHLGRILSAGIKY